jgi:hypothetical protein
MTNLISSANGNEAFFSFSPASSPSLLMRTPPTQRARWRRILSPAACSLLPFPYLAIKVSSSLVRFKFNIKTFINWCMCEVYEKLGYQWASSLLGFLAVGMMPFP